MPSKSRCGIKGCCCTGLDVSRHGILLAVVASSNVEAREFYRNMAHEAGSEVHFFEPHSNMSHYGGQYCGLVVDVPSFIRMEAHEKQAISLLQNIFPTIRSRIDSRLQTLRIVPLSGWNGDKGKNTFRDFVAYCRGLAPRKLRKDKRVPIHLPVVLLESPVANEKGERSVTINVSSGGCFFNTTGKWKVGNRIWFRFVGMADPTPVRGIICWVCPWGESSRIPGIGVAFESFTSTQRRDIAYAVQSGSLPAADLDCHRKAS